MVVFCMWEPVLFIFVSVKSPGYNVFGEPETINYKGINKSALITIKIYLEKDDHKEVNFDEETFLLSLQLIKN